MNIQLTIDQQAFVQRAVASGRLQHEDDAVQEALALWEERERGRLELVASLNAARASLAHGEGREISVDSMRSLAKEIKDRGRARLAAHLAQAG